MKKWNILIFLIIIFLSGCIIPVNPQSSNKQEDIRAEVVNFPKNAIRGENYKFSIRTISKSKCLGGIGYWTDESTNWKTIDFPEIIASNDGICQWEWRIPIDAKPGYAEFRAVVYLDNKSNHLMPSQFCIEECP